MERIRQGGRHSIAKINARKSNTARQEARKTLHVPVPTIAKCPTCWKLHETMLTPESIEKGKIPRIYCDLHRQNRYFTGDIYELSGHIAPLKTERKRQVAL